MAINVSFNGATIYKPGSYSKTTVDLGGGFPLGAAGLIALIGEADAGDPGSTETDIAAVSFTADQIPQIRAKYRSGPVVDAMNFLFSPASDAAIPNGAQRVWVYKTNSSVRATLAVTDSASAAYGTLRAREWGVGGNRVTAKITATAETPATVTGTAVLAGANVASTQTLVIAIDGVQVSHTIATSTDPATLATNLTTAFSGLSFTLDGSNHLVVTKATDANASTKDRGHNFEIMSTSTSLIALGLTAGIATAAVEPSVDIKLTQKRDNLSEEAILGGNIVLKIGYTGGSSTATVAVSATQVTLTAGSAITLDRAAYATLGQLVDDINLQTSWTAATASALYNQLPLAVLPIVTAVGAKGPGMPCQLKKDAFEVADFFAKSSLCEITSQATKGLPAAMLETALAGGAKGGTSSAAVQAALDAFTKFHVNSIVPLISRDATADIADGLTDATSTYTMAGVHQAVKTHISLMKTTKKRSERQGYLSMKASYAACQAQAGLLADARLQLVIQDVRQANAQGSIQWFQPWALAAMVAGSRAGAPIGTPLTFKFLNVSGIRQTAQAMSTAEASIVNDFDPDTMADSAIQSGITHLERPQTGGFRLVVDNTTYGVDDNWVFNRANVLYAADVVAFNLRNRLEAAFVGVKNTITPQTVSSFAASVLATFLSQGITVSTKDAPLGYKQLTVQIDGNTINVSCTVKLVEGIDFVLSDLTVQRAQQ